jgi:hypothetical protein
MHFVLMLHVLMLHVLMLHVLMLHVLMLHVLMLDVLMLGVIMPRVMAPPRSSGRLNFRGKIIDLCHLYTNQQAFEPNKAVSFSLSLQSCPYHVSNNIQDDYVFLVGELSPYFILDIYRKRLNLKHQTRHVIEE